MKPLFTCVVPSLNQGRFLGDALASLWRQGADDLEVVVVDGGSTDGSVDVIRAHADRIAWWCSEPDGGQSAAFNKGFVHARGDWLFWLNADDLLLPGALARVRTVLTACRKGGSPVEWVAGNEVYVDASGKVLKCLCGNHWHDGLYRHAVPHVFGPSSFFTRALFESAGGFDEELHVAMDFDLWIRFMKCQRARGVRTGFKRIDAYLWAWRNHDGSKTSSGIRTAAELARQAENVRRAFEKNDFTVTWRGSALARLWRVCDGSYLRSLTDTWRWRGRALEDLIGAECGIM